MAIEIKTEIKIKASPTKVWNLLTDIDNYSSWNPFIKSIQGKLEVGNQITVRIEPPEASGMTFKPNILAFDETKELRWLGKFFVRGLFDGEHKFEIIDNKNGTVKFVQSEKFKGLLVPLFRNQLENNTKSGFELMNNKLKELAEQ